VFLGKPVPLSRNRAGIVPNESIQGGIASRSQGEECEANREMIAGANFNDVLTANIAKIPEG
jgi:hypothetical protein